MKYLFSLLMLSSLLLAYDITISVKGSKNRQGKLYIGLYNTAKGFGTVSSKTFKRKIVKAPPKNARYTFKHLPKGTYAISLFHDENSNGKLDTNLLGIPKEGYGFSNNKRFALRAATFKESSFLLNKNKTITIKIGY